ncbi:hypothetical protein AB4K20DRAFT_1891316 [Rhizopus microsporus]
MKEISQLRSDILKEHMVFLAYVYNPDKVRSIQPSTVTLTCIKHKSCPIESR